MRTLSLPGGVGPSLLALAPHLGLLVAHSPDDLALHSFTINGRRAVSAEGSERLSSMAVSPDGRFLLTGGAKGLVTLRWLHSLQVDVTPCLLLAPMRSLQRSVSSTSSVTSSADLPD